MNLLTDASATGDYVRWGGGEAQFCVEGTFDGATVQLQRKGPNGTAIAIAGTALTANGMVNVRLPGNVELRAAVSGGDAPEGLYASLDHIGA